MTKIAPSILSADFADMGNAIEKLEQWKADYIHCDVMDGRYVPNISFGQQMIKQIRKRTKLPLDVHLMIQAPDEAALSFVDAGADFVTFHFDQIPHPHRVLGYIKNAGCKAGIVLNPGVSPRTPEYLYELCDMVLLMSVNPGYGGQKFIQSTLKKAEELAKIRSELGLDFEIEMDGGINLSTGPLAAQAGADVLVAGSAVFSAARPEEVIAQLQNAGK